MTARLQAIAGLIAVLLAVVLLALFVRSADGILPARLVLVLALAATGAVAIARALPRGTPAPFELAPVPPPARRPWTLLEGARWVAMLAGGASMVVAATWFRVALYDEASSLTRSTELAAIATFLVGGALFLRAYHAGTAVVITDPEADLWDRVVAWIEQHGAIPALLALAISSGMMFAGVFGGESIGDDLTFHMAESARLADCIRAGDWDFWNPSANGGYASAYYYQVIPQLASALPTALFGHHLFWFQLSLWLPLVIVPLAAYRGIRVMGASPWQAVAAALCVTFLSGASRWGSGADGTFQVGLYTQTWALAFFPLGLGYGVRFLLEGRNLPTALAWGALVFLCHPFASIALCIGLAVGVLAHYLQFPVRTPNLRLILLAVLGLAFALSLAALVLDRPVPPDSAPETVVAPIKYMYLAPLILFGGLLARVAFAGRKLSIALITGVALAFGANVIAMAILTVVPKRAEGATVDPPPEWQWGAASAYVGPLLLLAGIIGKLVVDARARRAPDHEAPSHAPRLLGAGALLGLALAVFLAGATGGNKLLVGLALLPGAGFVYLAWPQRHEPLIRLVVLGGCLAIATMPGWITVIVDREGFGGFPHRVWDEVGPGYKELARWYSQGEILDFKRLALLTWGLPFVIAFGRMKFGRWLWAPALTFAALLALGPHAPKTADDLLPAVRFLGAMQVVLGLAIGAGAFALVRRIWEGRPDRWPVLLAQRILPGTAIEELVYGIRTAIIALTCAVVIFVALQGSARLSERVNTLAAFDYHDEMFEMIDIIAKQPQGRKQVGPGCENHWWNMLSYVYAKRPSLLQMGGGGLQASPNYDFVYTVREFPKLAWVYDTPLFLFAKANGNAPDGEVLGETARYELRRLPAPGLVSPIQVTGVLPEGPSRAGNEVRNAALDWMKSDAPLSDHHLAYFGHGGLFQAPDAKVKRAFRVDPSPGELADVYADVEVKAPSTFVVRESWHPRWHAYVDGVEVPIRRVTPDFPAIDVGVGTHAIAFRFERPWWAHAAWLAWPGIVLAAWWLSRRSRQRAVTA